MRRRVEYLKSKGNEEEDGGETEGQMLGLESGAEHVTAPGKRVLQLVVTENVVACLQEDAGEEREWERYGIVVSE